jgi:1,2-diacylglycerol 3-beta-galactosyltransferase
VTTRVLILYSKTGGGHQSAGLAVTEALLAEYGSAAAVDMVDALTDVTPFPFNRFPAWYPAMARHRRVWRETFRVTNGVHRTRALSRLAGPLLHSRLRELVARHAPDIIVSVHPLLISPVLRALGPHRPPFISIVTDLVNAHAAWYYPGVDLCIVPTEPAWKLGLRYGLAPEQLTVVGLPISARFGEAVDAPALREQLGWPADRPTALLVGGGEGMGPVGEIARAIAAAHLSCHLAVVTGRNRALYAELQAVDWPIPTHIYGFSDNMPDLMRAASVLVTKAGPGTLSEAMAAGLPVIVYGYLPGQETANVGYVVGAGAGLWAPGPTPVAQALRSLLDEPPSGPARLREMAANARRLGHPSAAHDIARIIWERAQAARPPPSPRPQTGS